MDIKKLMVQHPEVAEMAGYREIFWTNPDAGMPRKLDFTMDHIKDAEDRLARFAPYLAEAFPETASTGGIIESPLTEIPQMKETLKDLCGPFTGRLFLKCDSHLPVSGSIKARGGIYEVLKFAEKVAMDAGMLRLTDDYSKLNGPEFRQLFSRYSVAVGSTGNLGLSIGIISARLGFQVTVHMSVDARQWKKDLLRSKGVTVVEYPDDYQKAVAEGRKAAAADPFCHFVDDEASLDLFMGYSVAARRIAAQFEKAGIAVDEDHPLFVYIPCGVGGAPGGVAFGLKTMFGDNVHIFFAEPTHAPCMTLSMITGLQNRIAVSDIGLDGKTDADGLAVGRASGLVSDVMKTQLSGCYTIDDYRLYPFLSHLADGEGIYIEPSSCASFPGPSLVSADSAWQESYGLTLQKMAGATHILWATGGSMVPEEEMQGYYERGRVSAATLSLLRDVHTRQADTVNGLMAPAFHSINPENRILTLQYKVKPWEANRFGQLHGGIMTTMLDHVCGLAVTTFTGHKTPTLSLTTDFIRPASVGDVLLATATMVSSGSRIIRMRGELTHSSTGKTVAVCSGTFFIKEE